MRIGLERSAPYCDGLGRRSFLQVGVAGMGSVGLADLLRARAASAERAPNTSVIMFWLDGGPSQIDLFDLKPLAPSEYRGIWNPIHTNVPGMELGELLPSLATQADKFSVLRSLNHYMAAHYNGCHKMLNAREDPTGDGKVHYPSLGSIAGKICGPRRPGIPPYVSVPSARTAGLTPGYLGASYLGPAHDPFQAGADPNEPDFNVRNLKPPEGVTLARLEDRQTLRQDLDRLRRDLDASGTSQAMDRFQHEAIDLVLGSAACKAFDIAAEDPRLRDEYGRNTWGQSALLARRLVEAGCTFVTMHLSGWDHHAGVNRGMQDFCPKLDRAATALFADLQRRGLLDQVLVLICGEFGRTPRLNAGDARGPGRDHWPNAYSCLLGGGGLRGGQVVGATTARGEAPLERPLSPGDLHATIYRVLGVNPSVSFLNRAGRPVPILDHGEVIRELV